MIKKQKSTPTILLFITLNIGKIQFNNLTIWNERSEFNALGRKDTIGHFLMKNICTIQWFNGVLFKS